MVLDVLMGLIWMFGPFFLILWIMESPNYEFEELIELLIQVRECVEAFECLC